MFIIILADRGLKYVKNTVGIDLGLPALQRIDRDTAAYIFERLPHQLAGLLGDSRLFVALAALFLFKQIISLWPSSDMRRMHRQEREGFGLLASLAAIRWEQLVWDAIAVATLCLAAGGWCLIWFAINRFLWLQHPSTVWIFLLALAIVAIAPMMLAGFSYSSKLAVITSGRFVEKLALFYKLFTDRRVALGSLVFYTARMLVEAIFVAAIPAYILLKVDNYPLRIMLAATLATPAYSYLKMASFKFFLVVYARFPLVRREYRTYYRQLAGG